MTEFRVGDRVRIIAPQYELFNGHETTVARNLSGDYVDLNGDNRPDGFASDFLWPREQVFPLDYDWVVPLTPEEDGVTSTIVDWPALGRAIAEDNKRIDIEDYADPTDFEMKVAELFSDAHDSLLSKHHDYGPLNIARSPGGPLNGLRVRLWDKLARLNHLVDSGAQPENESLEDTFRDIVGYGAIGLLVLRGDWPDE